MADGDAEGDCEMDTEGPGLEADFGMDDSGKEDVTGPSPAAGEDLDSVMEDARPLQLSPSLSERKTGPAPWTKPHSDEDSSSGAATLRSSPQESRPARRRNLIMSDDELSDEEPKGSKQIESANAKQPPDSKSIKRLNEKFIMSDDETSDPNTEMSPRRASFKPDSGVDPKLSELLQQFAFEDKIDEVREDLERERLELAKKYRDDPDVVVSKKDIQHAMHGSDDSDAVGKSNNKSDVTAIKDSENDADSKSKASKNLADNGNDSNDDESDGSQGLTKIKIKQSGKIKPAKLIIASDSNGPTLPDDSEAPVIPTEILPPPVIKSEFKSVKKDFEIIKTNSTKEIGLSKGVPVKKIPLKIAPDRKISRDEAVRLEQENREFIRKVLLKARKGKSVDKRNKGGASDDSDELELIEVDGDGDNEGSGRLGPIAVARNPKTDFKAELRRRAEEQTRARREKEIEEARLLAEEKRKRREARRARRNQTNAAEQGGEDNDDENAELNGIDIDISIAKSNLDAPVAMDEGPNRGREATPVEEKPAFSGVVPHGSRISRVLGMRTAKDRVPEVRPAEESQDIQAAEKAWDKPQRSSVLPGLFDDSQGVLGLLSGNFEFQQDKVEGAPVQDEENKAQDGPDDGGEDPNESGDDEYQENMSMDAASVDEELDQVIEELKEERRQQYSRVMHSDDESLELSGSDNESTTSAESEEGSVTNDTLAIESLFDDIRGKLRDGDEAKLPDGDDADMIKDMNGAQDDGEDAPITWKRILDGEPQKSKQRKPKKKSAFIEAEAEEEEDEFMGLAGSDEESEISDEEALVCSGDEDVIEDFDDIMELHRQRELEEDGKLVETLLNDVTSGNLRRRMLGKGDASKGFALSDSEDEQELLKSIRRGWYRSAPSENVDENQPYINQLAGNSETAAFARCFSTLSYGDSGEPGESLISDEEEEIEFKGFRMALSRQISGADKLKKPSKPERELSTQDTRILTKSLSVLQRQTSSFVDGDSDEEHSRTHLRRVETSIVVNDRQDRAGDVVKPPILARNSRSRIARTFSSFKTSPKGSKGGSRLMDVVEVDLTASQIDSKPSKAAAASKPQNRKGGFLVGEVAKNASMNATTSKGLGSSSTKDSKTAPLRPGHGLGSVLLNRIGKRSSFM
ncbi:hypothetical protein HDU96_004957 [Phlyctochytrium bullatum]|nr:hypothetical protein HDU96_004957 [Phlyctochytrium bullatum]